MNKLAALPLVVALLAGCAVVRYADGQRVAIEHDPEVSQAELQSKADAACVQSGGHSPAKQISTASVNPSLPASMVRKVATFNCG